MGVRWSYWLYRGVDSPIQKGIGLCPKQSTKPVEVHGMVFWTRVRLPSTPWLEKSRKKAEFIVESMNSAFLMSPFTDQKSITLSKKVKFFVMKIVMRTVKKRGHFRVYWQRPSEHLYFYLPWHGSTRPSWHRRFPSPRIMALIIRRGQEGLHSIRP